MRDPRPGLPWSRGRIERRTAYAAYMDSPAWFARREAWYRAFVATDAAQPLCTACGVAWMLDHGDLHHRTYGRLGNERDEDLMPMCRDCHDELHRILERNPAWRRMGRPQATDLIVTGMARRLSDGVGTDGQ